MTERQNKAHTDMHEINKCITQIKTKTHTKAYIQTDGHTDIQKYRET